MVKIYLKQAWVLLKQNPLFSTLYIVGTGLAIAMTMIVAVIYYVKVAPVYPEVNRMQTLYLTSASFQKGTEQIKQYIRENYSDSGMGVDQLAREVGMTPNYLSSIFKKNTGENLSRYLKGFRMERAREMLENTNEKIGIICEKCGFVNVSYFCQSFREYFGISPQKYRDQGE